MKTSMLLFIGAFTFLSFITESEADPCAPNSGTCRKNGCSCDTRRGIPCCGGNFCGSVGPPDTFIYECVKRGGDQEEIEDGKTFADFAEDALKMLNDEW